MNHRSHFHGCTPEQIHGIAPQLRNDVESIVKMLTWRGTEEEMQQDLFWLFTHKRFCHDRIPVGTPDECPFDLDLLESLSEIEDYNIRSLCLASTAFDTHWQADFGRRYGDRLVQAKAQFGRMDSLYRDFCGFRIAQVEQGLALGIELVPVDPGGRFGRRQRAPGELADFESARKILTSLVIDMPIWLIGLGA